MDLKFFYFNADLFKVDIKATSVDAILVLFLLRLNAISKLTLCFYR